METITTKTEAKEITEFIKELLTTRQLECLSAWLFDSKRQKDIGLELGICQNTVSRHCKAGIIRLSKAKIRVPSKHSARPRLYNNINLFEVSESKDNYF